MSNVSAETAAKLAERLAECATMCSAPVPKVGAALIRADGKPITADAIAKEIGCPQKFVGKALKTLHTYRFAVEDQQGWRVNMENILGA